MLYPFLKTISKSVQDMARKRGRDVAGKFLLFDTAGAAHRLPGLARRGPGIDLHVGSSLEANFLRQLDQPGFKQRLSPWESIWALNRAEERSPGDGLPHSVCPRPENLAVPCSRNDVHSSGRLEIQRLRVHLISVLATTGPLN